MVEAKLYKVKEPFNPYYNYSIPNFYNIISYELFKSGLRSSKSLLKARDYKNIFLSVY
jgi:hypothetical protein